MQSLPSTQALTHNDININPIIKTEQEKQQLPSPYIAPMLRPAYPINDESQIVKNKPQIQKKPQPLVNKSVRLEIKLNTISKEISEFESIMFLILYFLFFILLILLMIWLIDVAM